MSADGFRDGACSVQKAKHPFHRHKRPAPLYTELFDHHNDPSETENIAAKEPALVKKLNQQLNNLLK